MTLFYRWWNWGTKKLHGFPRVKEENQDLKYEDCEKIIGNRATDKGLTFKIYKLYIEAVYWKKQTTQSKNGQI